MRQSQKAYEKLAENMSHGHIERVETIEAKAAYEAIKAINTLLSYPAGEQIYSEQIAELFKTLHLINMPMLQVDNT